MSRRLTTGPTSCVGTRQGSAPTYCRVRNLSVETKREVDDYLWVQRRWDTDHTRHDDPCRSVFTYTLVDRSLEAPPRGVHLDDPVNHRTVIVGLVVQVTSGSGCGSRGRRRGHRGGGGSPVTHGCGRRNESRVASVDRKERPTTVLIETDTMNSHSSVSDYKQRGTPR